jgi:hypothetical protein
MSSKTEDKSKKRNKSGPKGPYAVNKVIKTLSPEKIKDIQYRYYNREVSNSQLGRELGLSHPMIPKLLKALGSPPPEIFSQ